MMPRLVFSMFCAAGAMFLGGVLCVAPLAGLYALVFVALTAYGLHLRYLARGQPRSTQGDIG